MLAAQQERHMESGSLDRPKREPNNQIGQGEVGSHNQEIDTISV